jgi:dCMP deaminase
MLINAGVVRIVYADGYPDELGLQMLKAAGVELYRMPERGVVD